MQTQIIASSESINIQGWGKKTSMKHSDNSKIFSLLLSLLGCVKKKKKKSKTSTLFCLHY